MATGVRTPVGIRDRLAGPAAARRARHARCARVVERVPGHAQRGVRVAGRRDLADVRRRRRRRCARFGVDPGAVRADGRSAARPAAQLGEIEDDGRRLLRVRVAPELARRAPARPGRPAARASRFARAARGRRRAAGAAGAARPARRYVRRPAALRTEHGELVRLRLRRPRATAPTCSATSSARAARSTRAVAPGETARSRPGERIEWTGQYELLGRGAAPACAGSCRWSRSRCWACCSCSSAA